MNQMKAFLQTSISVLCLAGSAAAQDYSKVDLLPGWRTEAGTQMAGIRIRLAPGWHTYWRQPMGNGIPPHFDWSGSDNLGTVRVHWPAPNVIESFGSVSAGYHDEVIFPIEVTAADSGAPVQLDLNLFYGVCEQVCIPSEADVALTLPPGAGSDNAEIKAALARRTQPALAAGVIGHNCHIRPEGDSYALTAALTSRHRLPAPEMVVFEAGSEEIWISPKRWAVADDGLRIDAELSYYGSGSFAFDRSLVRITLIGQGGAVELTGCPAG